MLSIRPVLLLAALILIPSAVQAQAEAPSDKPAGPRDPSLTQERLRRCIAMEIANDDQKALMKQANEELEIARRASRELGRDIDRQRRGLDRSDSAAVRAFNERINQHDALIKEQDAKMDVYNALVDTFNPMVQQFNAACAGAAYPWRERAEEKQRQLKAREAARARSGS